MDKHDLGPEAAHFHSIPRGRNDGFRITITSQHIADLMVTCFEGGSNYWLQSAHPLTPDMVQVVTQAPWYSDRKFWEQDAPSWAIQIELREPGDLPDGNPGGVIDAVAIVRGLNRMAERHADMLRDIFEDNGDAETSDVFLQFCLFDEIVYG